MTDGEIERLYHDLGGVNFFRILILEDEEPDQSRLRFLTAANAFPHLAFHVESRPTPETALAYLHETKNSHHNLHLLIVDYDLGQNGYSGVSFLKDAQDICGDAMFAFSTGYLQDAWHDCGLLSGRVRNFVIDNQLYPHVKGEGGYKEQIAHFLSKYRDRISERRSKPATSVIITARDELSKVALGFPLGPRRGENAWFMTPVAGHKLSQGGSCFTDDPLSLTIHGESDAVSSPAVEFETALVIHTSRPPARESALSGGLQSADARGGIVQTYVARRHFKSFYHVQTERQWHELMFRPQELPTLDLRVRSTYALCFNMNLVWLSRCRREFRPITKINDKHYVLTEAPRDLYFGGIKGRDLCNRFNALAHLYRHFNATSFFQNERGEFADTRTVRDLAEDASKSMQMASNVETYIDDGTTLWPVYRPSPGTPAAPLSRGPGKASRRTGPVARRRP